jgi:hypothetical protein
MRRKTFLTHFMGQCFFKEKLVEKFYQRALQINMIQVHKHESERHIKSYPAIHKRLMYHTKRGLFQ